MIPSWQIMISGQPFLTWLLIGWQLQWQKLLAKNNFNTKLYWRCQPLEANWQQAIIWSNYKPTHISVTRCNEWNSLADLYCVWNLTATDVAPIHDREDFFEWMISTQIAKFKGPIWGPPGSCQPQMGPMLAPLTLPSGWHFRSMT